jgi:ribonuclease HI
MMTLWRIWHNHNELTHDKPYPSIEGSRRFLVSYLNSLLIIKQFPDADVQKGKMVINQSGGFKQQDKQVAGRQQVKKRWKKPVEGRVKLNVDGGFSRNGAAGAGMVLRDHNGGVIAAACRYLDRCGDATEAELQAIEEGMRLAMHWTTLPITLETDCSEAIELIKDKNQNISVYAFTISAIRELLQERDICVTKISRDANMVSHELAKLGRINHRTAVWYVDFPQEIEQAIACDCNPVSS